MLQEKTKRENYVPFTGKNKSGYMTCKMKSGSSLVHRRVAEKQLGRPLKSGEEVHHKNHIRTDNGPSNLKVYKSHAEHMKKEH